MKKITHVDPYDSRRADEYPPIQDQLDAIWKALAKLQTLPPDTQSMLNEIQAVKDKYPKPCESGASSFVGS